MLSHLGIIMGLSEVISLGERERGGRLRVMDYKLGRLVNLWALF